MTGRASPVTAAGSEPLGNEAIVWALAAVALKNVAPAIAMPSAAPSLFFMMPPFVREGQHAGAAFRRAQSDRRNFIDLSC